MVLTLPADGDVLWKQLSAKVRNQVRKGDSMGLGIGWGTGLEGERLLPDFYYVFSVNMRDLGTPVYPKRLFRKILSSFGSDAEFAVVYYEKRPIAAALLVHDGGGAGRPALTQVPSASSLRGYNHTNANMWMYHRLLCRAIERGSGAFDFGRSSEGSGTYRFKKQWGALPQPTVWQYCLRKGEMNAMRPDHPRQRRRVERWKKLPVWLTRLVGPVIIRGIP